MVNLSSPVLNTICLKISRKCSALAMVEMHMSSLLRNLKCIRITYSCYSSNVSHSLALWFTVVQCNTTPAVTVSVLLIIIIKYLTPIHKKGNKKLASNYRPVSLTSITCKMMENIMYSFIIDYIYANNYFSNFQHGFMKGRSIISHLLEIMDHLTESFDLDTQIDCIYLDFKKAFDSVSHELLIHKLKSYNISDSMITWLSSFLNNRKQSLRINGSTSSWTSVTSGVPQGSILGSLMFLLFVNDIPQITSSNIMLFADDTKLWRLIKSIDDVNILREDL